MINDQQVENKLKEYESLMIIQKHECEQKIRQEHKDDLEKQKHEYEEKLEKQKQEYEEKLEKEREVIRKMAMRSKTTNKTTVNNMNTLNFNDTERLNQVIHNNINEQVVEQGQVGIAGVIYHKFLKDENGKQLYVLMDGARQIFRFVDPKGNVVTDVGAKILTDAISSSNLEREMCSIAKNMNGLHDNKERFENVMSLSSEFKTDNSTFRKEIVHLAKKEQKGKTIT
jgi:DNA polymerase II small subunit/DNA polymerase delta subunit B